MVSRYILNTEKYEPLNDDNGTTLKIYSTFHDIKISQDMFKNKIVIPFYSKARYRNKKNINQVQRFLNEFVTMYYVYKNNLKTDMVGFCHYRRMFYEPHFDLKKTYVLNIFKNDFKRNHFFKRIGSLFLYDDLQDYIKGKYKEDSFEYTVFTNSEKGITWVSNMCYICNWDIFSNMMDFILGYIDYINIKYKLDYNFDKYKDFFDNYWSNIENEILAHDFCDWFGNKKNLREKPNQYRTFAYIIEFLVGIYLFESNKNNIVNFDTLFPHDQKL